MTTKYDVRNPDGILIATISSRMMSVFTRSNGKWRSYKTKERDTVCFEFEVDSKLEFDAIGVPMNLFLWAGSKIIPVD